MKRELSDLNVISTEQLLLISGGYDFSYTPPPIQFQNNNLSNLNSSFQYNSPMQVPSFNAVAVAIPGNIMVGPGFNIAPNVQITPGIITNLQEVNSGGFILSKEF